MSQSLSQSYLLMVIFPKSWNNALIVSIPNKKKGVDPSDCNDYRGFSLINNGLKIVAIIIAIIESLNMELIKDLLSQNNMDFVKEKNV